MRQVSSLEQFHHWKADMNEAIERFLAQLPVQVRKALDGSDASLHHLEGWLLSRYADPKSALAATETLRVDGAARYLGEVFRERTGSDWSIDLANSKDVFFGVPVLRGGSLRAPLCPLTTVTAATDRRTGTYFATILGSIAASPR